MIGRRPPNERIVSDVTFTRNEMLTRDVCERLNVTPSAVSRMVKRGALKPKRVIQTGRAGVFIFRRSDVEKLAAKRAS